MDLKKDLEIIKAATPGRWNYDNEGIWAEDPNSDFHDNLDDIYLGQLFESPEERNNKFVAHFCPDYCKELVEEIKQLQEALSEKDQEILQLKELNNTIIEEHNTQAIQAEEWAITQAGNIMTNQEIKWFKTRDEELEKDRKICDAATPGPWAWTHTSEKDNGYVIGIAVDFVGNHLSGFQEYATYNDSLDDFVENILEMREIGEHEESSVNYCDAEFITHFRSRVPELLDELAKLKDQCEELNLQVKLLEIENFELKSANTTIRTGKKDPTNE